MTKMNMLKKVIQFTLLLIFLFFISFAAFFLWASSPNHLPSEYSLHIKKDIPSELNKDSVYNIVTYNIGYLSGMTNNRPVIGNQSFYDNNLKKALEKFKTLNPEIICLQEIDFDSERSFNVNQQSAIQNLGYGHISQAVNWDETYLPFPGSFFNYDTHYGEVYSGQSIISKFPLKDNKRVVLERPENLSFHRG